jgi:hypothetical protein
MKVGRVGHMRECTKKMMPLIARESPDIIHTDFASLNRSERYESRRPW